MPQVIIYAVASFICAFALALAITRFLGLFVRVKGSSMKNTLHDGNILLAVRPGRYHRGEVVLCRYPHRAERTIELGAAFSLTWHTLFVKRLVALPGDTVEIREGQLFVNDSPVPDPPAMGSAPSDYPPRTLRSNQYFVLGDNRRASHDSRAADVGPISGKMLQGHVKAVLWPPGMIQTVK